MSYIRYDDLDVYKRARHLAIELHKLSLEWPKIEQFNGIADQLRRSSKSINANLAEGLSKNTSVADKCRFLQIALGSAEECRVWLDFACELGYVNLAEAEHYRKTYQEIAAQLYRLQQSIRKS